MLELLEQMKLRGMAWARGAGGSADRVLQYTVRHGVGIGRQARLRTVCRKTCGFDPHPWHQLQKNPLCVSAGFFVSERTPGEEEPSEVLLL